VLLTCYKQSGCTDGAVARYYRYDGYGTLKALTTTGAAVTSGSELTDVLYTGQRWHSWGRLYDYGARLYDPRIARFVSTDPIREYMNPYAYVAWNPVMRTDPTGKYSELAAATIIAAFAKAGVEYVEFGVNLAAFYAATSGGLASTGGGTTSLSGGALGASIQGAVNAQLQANFAAGIQAIAGYNVAKASADLFGDLYRTLADFAQLGQKFQTTERAGHYTARATLGSDQSGKLTTSLGVVHNPGNATHPDGYPLHSASLDALLRTSALGAVVRVHGGQRTPSQNVAAGGKPGSYHLTVGNRVGDGTAVDFGVEGHSHHSVAQFVFQQGIFRGVGYNNVHVHGDLRPTPVFFLEVNR
jgi:RHS repeat-associated protein